MRERKKTDRQKERTKKAAIMKRQNYRYIIAIDPDCEMSGVATVDTTNGEIKVRKMTFPEVIKYLKDMQVWKEDPLSTDDYSFKVVLEAGWLNQGNWHLGHGKYMTANRAAAIGRSVGLNHQTGILMKEMCEDMMIPSELQMPYRKTWQGKDGKITQGEIESLTGHPKLPRMNQDQRDALLIAWVHSGLPMKTVTTKKTDNTRKTIPKETQKTTRMTLEDFRKTFK